MTSELLIHIAGLLASAGIIAAIVYLTLQVRNNTNALKATNNNAAASNSVAILGQMFATPEFTEFLIRVQTDIESATPAERRRLHVFLLAGFRHWDNLFSQFRRGTLDPEIWLSYDRTMISWLENETFREWYKQNTALFSESLRHHLRRLLE